MQVYLITVGCTTYEQFKRNAAYKDMRDLAVAQAAVAAAQGIQDQQHSQLTPQQYHEVAQQYWQMQEQQADGILWWLPWRRRKGPAGAAAAKAAVTKPDPPYHRGWKQNWFEVLFPEQFLQQQQQQQQPRGHRGRVRHQQQQQQQRNAAGLQDGSEVQASQSGQQGPASVAERKMQ